jgi:hypothetical protein
MGDDVNCARMLGVEGQRAPRHLFGAAVLAILFQAESIERKNARIARSRRIPFGQNLGDAISQHAPLAKTEVKGMRGGERDEVQGPVNEDGAIKFGCKSLVAVEPSTRRECVTTRGVVPIRTLRLNCGQAVGKLGSRGMIVGLYDERGAQAMAEDELGIVS